MNKRIVWKDAQSSQLFASTTGEKAIGETSAFYLGVPIGAEIYQAGILLALQKV